MKLQLNSMFKTCNIKLYEYLFDKGIFPTYNEGKYYTYKMTTKLVKGLASYADSLPSAQERFSKAIFGS